MSLHAFYTKIDESAEFRERVNTITSPAEFLALTQEFSVELTGEEFQTIVQNAFQHWVSQLKSILVTFFSKLNPNQK